LAKRISATLFVLVAFLVVAGKLLVTHPRCRCPIPMAVAEKESKALSALKHGDVFRSIVVATCC
jgi:hypothetical protein